MKIIVTDLNGRELSDVKFKVEFTKSEMDVLKYPEFTISIEVNQNMPQSFVDDINIKIAEKNERVIKNKLGNFRRK
jgi:hypothetical protein